MKSGFFIFLIVIVSSCTSLSKEDCQKMNWQERGKADALRGKTLKALSNYSFTCSEHGISVPQESYMKGRKIGLEHFCTFEGGQQFGREGETYRSTCPNNLEAEFLKGYSLGSREYEIERRERELDLREQELEENESNFRARQSFLPSTNSDQCTFNSDCTVEGDCSFGKCSNSGTKCSFDSDCSIQGRCTFGSICAEGDCNSINMCKYDR